MVDPRDKPGAAASDRASRHGSLQRARETNHGYPPPGPNDVVTPALKNQIPLLAMGTAISTNPSKPPFGCAHLREPQNLRRIPASSAPSICLNQPSGKT